MQVITTYYAEFAGIGPLPAGIYNVNAELWMTEWPQVSGGELTRTASLTFDVEGDVVITDVALPGDYNDDGMVDAADYTVWAMPSARRRFCRTTRRPAQ